MSRVDWVEVEVPPVGLTAPVAGLTPAGLIDTPNWFFVTTDGQVVGVDLETGERFFSATLPFTVEPGASVELHASDDGRFLAIAQSTGRAGIVYDMSTQRAVLELSRGDYHPEHCPFPLLFLDTHRLVHAVEWNQLAVTDVRTGLRLDRAPEDTRLDYFFGPLTRSPSGARLASAGWVWHPLGVVASFDVSRWLAGHEPELQWHAQSEAWGLPVCWLDETRLVSAVVGLDAPEGGQLVLHRLDAEEPIAGTPGPGAFELARRRDELLLLGESTLALSTSTLEPASRHEKRATSWHPGAQQALSMGASGWALLSRPRPVPGTSDALRSLARRAHDAGTRESRLVLADALEAAGRAGDDVDHLRATGPHGRRCHVVEDLALG